MKNTTLLLLPLILILSCKKNSIPKEETLTPTTAEKKIIDAASAFFKNGGDYYQIENNYRVALRPVLTVRRALMEGPCTQNVFLTEECCCPWHFLLTPYDAMNGNGAIYNYPKSALFVSKPGKMEGAITANFSQRPVSSDITEVQYDHLAFAGTDVELDGIVVIKDVIVALPSNNVMCRAEFSNNSFVIASGQITLSGHLTFTNGDAGGILDVTYPDNRKLKADISLSNFGEAGFLQKASFTMDGITSDIDAEKQTITIGERVFKLSLN